MAAIDGSDVCRGLALVVDDQRIHRVLLQQLLQKIGFDVVLAANGLECLEVFKNTHPDVVFLDVIMPVMDGFEAAQQIKALPEGQFTPIIFLTSLNRPSELWKCIESGGDDFISKPINPVTLNSRIVALERTRELYRSIHAKNQELQRYFNERKENETLALNVYQHALSSRNTTVAGLTKVSYPAERFSGDIVLHAFLPDGCLRILLADFTGHGLPAAIVALPVSEMFHHLTLRGASQLNLLQALNTALCQLLPNDRFMAAVMLDIDLILGHFTFWSGGMPSSLILQSGACETLTAHGLPLGILQDYDFLPYQQQFCSLENVKVLLLSDGLLDARNTHGQSLVQSSVYQEFIADWQQSLYPLDRLVESVLQKHQVQRPLEDDITLVEINLADVQIPYDASR